MTAAELFARWMSDFPAFARAELRIKGKDERVVPFALNAPQRLLHDAIEGQLAETGKVRVILLKARRLGASTYVSLRFFAKMYLTPRGRRAFLLTHEQAATKKLVAMYHQAYNGLDPTLRRPASAMHTQGIAFQHGGELEARTASTPEGGRGGTVSLYHWSEMAFSEHAESHAVGSMDQLAPIPGTEMILESTANGAMGAFYERWRSAKHGKSEFLPIFLPWFTHPEYVADPPSGFRLSHEKPNDLVMPEVEYADAYGLTDAQMAFRRAWIQSKDDQNLDGALLWSQEYPAVDTEAFLSGNEDSFISPTHVEAARVRPASDGYQMARPLVIGIDPAPQHGSSSTAVVWRRGTMCYRLERWDHLTPDALLHRLLAVFQDDRPARVCIDESEGVGHYLCTTLPAMSGLGGKVVGVRFGNAAFDSTRYANVRAEIWSKMAAWMRDAAIVDEPYKAGQPTLASELLSVKRKPDERRIQLEAKAEVVKRLGVSPDGADALACTFYYPDPDEMTEMLAVQAPVAGRMRDRERVTMPGVVRARTRGRR